MTRYGGATWRRSGFVRGIWRGGPGETEPEFRTGERTAVTNSPPLFQVKAPAMSPTGSGSLTHDHDVLSRTQDESARRTLSVVGLTAVMMVGEIAAGMVYGSMALLADGFQGHPRRRFILNLSHRRSAVDTP